MYTNWLMAELLAFITTTTAVEDAMVQETAATDVAKSAPVKAEHRWLTTKVPPVTVTVLLE